MKGRIGWIKKGNGGKGNSHSKIGKGKAAIGWKLAGGCFLSLMAEEGQAMELTTKKEESEVSASMRGYRVE